MMKAKLRQKGNSDPSSADIFRGALRMALKVAPKKVDVSSNASQSIKVTSPEGVKIKITSPGEVENSQFTSPEEVNTPRQQTQSDRVYISVSEKKTAFKQAGNQCTFISPINGRRCTENHFLQVEHIVPVAMGGSSERENLTVLCACHNRLNAIYSFGREKMEPYLRL